MKLLAKADVWLHKRVVNPSLRALQIRTGISRLRWLQITDMFVVLAFFVQPLVYAYNTFSDPNELKYPGSFAIGLATMLFVAFAGSYFLLFKHRNHLSEAIKQFEQDGKLTTWATKLHYNHMIGGLMLFAITLLLLGGVRISTWGVPVQNIELYVINLFICLGFWLSTHLCGAQDVAPHDRRPFFGKTTQS